MAAKALSGQARDGSHLHISIPVTPSGPGDHVHVHTNASTPAAPPEPASTTRADVQGDMAASNGDVTLERESNGDTRVPPSPDSSSVGTPRKRKASSPTMSASAVRAGKTTRIRKACDICRMRKIKCDGVSPCKPCQTLGAQCTFQYVSRHRGPVSRYAGGGWRSGDAAVDTDSLAAEAPTTTPASEPHGTTAKAPISDVQMASQANPASSPGLCFSQLYAPVYLPQAPLPEIRAQSPPRTIDTNRVESINSSTTDHSSIINHHSPSQPQHHHNHRRSMDHTTQNYTPAAPPAISYSTSYFDLNGQPQINIYPHMPRPPELPSAPPHPPPPPPLSPLSPPSPPSPATDAIAPLHVLELLVDDFFTYIHPLIPFPHEPTFRRRFADPQERQSPRCLALLASMIGCLAASFPRSVRAHLRARCHSDKPATSGNGKFARAICMVECCRDVAMTARGAKFYTRPMLSVDDAATSYFLGLAAGYTFDWRLCRRFMAESMSFVQELGFHRPAGPTSSAVSTMAPVAASAASAAAAGIGTDGADAGSSALSALYTAPPPFNHIDDQVGKRIFWILYLAMRSLIQLGAGLSETPLPPFNNARPFPDLPAEVDDAYIEPHVIHAQPAGSVSLITGFNKTIQIYATMDPIATMEYACGLHRVPPSAQRAMFVEAIKTAKIITDTLPDELYLPLPGHADASTADSPHMTPSDPNGPRSAGSDTSTPMEVLYDELSGYRYYPPTADDETGQRGAVLRRSSSVSSPMNPKMSYRRSSGTEPASASSRRSDDLRLLLGADPARRRQVQYDIQKTNIYASQLATRSYFVEMYLHLNERTRGGDGDSEAEVGESLVAGERERIVHSLLFVLAAIPQCNMEPNGSALINKIRQVASTILGAGAGADTSEAPGGTQASPMEAQLVRFLEILIRLEKTGGPGRPSTSAMTVSSDEDVDDEEELQNWASLREEQMRFAASGGFLNTYV